MRGIAFVLDPDGYWVELIQTDLKYGTLGEAQNYSSEKVNGKFRKIKLKDDKVRGT